MILGANFESESGPEILWNVSLIIRFGGHVTIKKGTGELTERLTVFELKDGNLH